MSSYRNNVMPGRPMFLAVLYSAEGRVITAAGPYAARGAANGQTRRLLRNALHYYPQAGLVARVVTATPEWSPVDRTEVRP